MPKTFPYYHISETPSTQMLAREWCRTETLSDDPEISIPLHDRADISLIPCIGFLADRQTQGIGRRGRAWQSPRGNLATSLVMRLAPDLAALSDAERVTILGQQSFVMALAGVETIRETLMRAGMSLDTIDQNLRIKWPNDLLWQDKKIAGFLLESVAPKDHAYMILGLGLNLAAAPETTQPTTCLADISPSAVIKPMSFIERFVPHLMTVQAIYQRHGFGAIRKAWLEHAAFLDQDITARTPQGPEQGRFKTIDERGMLCLETTSGMRHIHTGDVMASQAMPN